METLETENVEKVMYAHSLEHESTDSWQTLEAHAAGVASLAAQFGISFSSRDTCRLLGLIHDLGKCRPAFQTYLMRSNGVETDGDATDHAHAGAGACWVNNQYRGIGRLLAYPLAGHHAGLTDWYATKVADAALVARLDSEKGMLDEEPVKKWIARFSHEWLKYRFEKPWPHFAPRDVAFWIRMLYSCLVDADFLDTERFMDCSKSDSRTRFAKLEDLQNGFFSRLTDLRGKASKSPVNTLRHQILEACLKSAVLPPGLFTLSVPTGGGKTLSSTAFAFRHAQLYSKKRIIYVIPYTSIVEQTAGVLRAFAGEENVVEHHCNLDPAQETTRSRLASENWDAPIIVTTAVQFFESLYACRSSRCRKLHNICESVVILDEVQLLPPELLLPIAESIHQLSSHYGCSFVLSTATQTSIHELAPLKDDSLREIIPSDMNLYRDLKRTQIELPVPDSPRMTWEQLASELVNHDQVLCVVNTRRDCRDLFKSMPKGTIHLSASMCGEHRSHVIAEIKRRLSAGESVRVISTQLVEAGVDVDFPIVYRAFTGLPSIVQTAGRCNREGRRAIGRVVVFNPPAASPVGSLRWYEDAFRSQLAANPELDLDSPDVFPDFYRHFYAMHHDLGTDFKELLERDAGKGYIQFRTACEKFNMIDSRGTQSVIVRYGRSEESIRSLRAVGPKRDIMRKLQRYAVTLPKWTFERMLENGAFAEAYPKSGIYVQEAESAYDPVFGLDLEWQGLTIDENII